MPKIDLEKFAAYTDMYEFVDELYEEASTIPIRLTDEKYYATILKYDTIDLLELDNDDDTATLKFKFNFIENPHELKEEDEEFNKHIGNLLVNIIINTLNGNENAVRNNDLESTNSQ
jgi:uncharacterized protein YdaT